MESAAPAAAARPTVPSRPQSSAIPPRARRAAFGWLARLAGLAAVAALAGCEPYVEGNGVLGEEQRAVAEFGGLEIADGIQAAVAAGTAERSVVVRGDENVLKNVETVVENRAPHGQTLIVRAAYAYQSTHPVQVLVNAPAFAFVAARDASPVSVTGAAAEVFTVEASGGSSVTLAGAGGQRLSLTLGGGARVDARGYPVAVADVAISAGASAAVLASASVTGTAAGAASRVENTGAGACQVAATDGAQVVCAGP